MKFGLCCSAETARDAIEAGFDYAEVGAFNLPEKLPLLEGLPVEATNLFFPPAFRLFEPAVGDWREHARTVTHAAGAVGARIMVVGSGGQRRSGPEVRPDEALARFVEIVSFIQEQAAPYGITAAPESLNRDETNVANDLAEMALALQAAGLSYTADSYHVLRECHYGGVPLDWSAQLPFAPVHAHFADLPRNVPSLDDEATLGFLRRLRELNYNARLSFEGSLGDFKLEQAVERLHTLWQLASQA